jgi:hypothetical protein
MPFKVTIAGKRISTQTRKMISARMGVSSDNASGRPKRLSTWRDAFDPIPQIFER